ncbi:MAG: NAD(P)/FAD-dependent oxidoreductase [Myxococcota bacterium]
MQPAMSLDAEVVVVGGGLAGSAVAVHLADRGHEVIVVDRVVFPRDKPCGEGLMPHGLHALGRLGVAPPVDARPFGGIRWTAGGVTAVGRFPEGVHGLGVRRAALDAALHARATAHPRISVRTPIRVDGLGHDADGVTVRTDHGPIRARLVVGADGLHSRIRHWTGLERAPRGRKRYGVRGHLTLAPGVADPPWVDVELVDGAELYVTPVGPGQVNVAALCERDTARGLKGAPAEVLARWLAGSRLGESLVAGPSADVRVTGPLRQQVSGVIADRVVLVGDAAGFLDGITGEGMSTGLGSAELAADVVSAGLRGAGLDRAALRPYAIAHRRLVRETDWLTEVILWGVARRWLAERVVRNLARRPQLFDRLLAIETGAASLSSIGVSGLLGLVA